MKTQIRISRQDRDKVLNKYNCKCAYCGNALTLATLKLDSTNNQLYPSCMRCKRRKGSKSIEQYRSIIKSQYYALNALSSKYNLCKDYGMVADVTNEVIFHFEK
jgi:hypothetical protein